MPFLSSDSYAPRRCLNENALPELIHFYAPLHLVAFARSPRLLRQESGDLAGARVHGAYVLGK